MPRTGRPPKPLEEKRRLGNPGQRRLPQPGSLALVPAPDRTLADQTALEAFENVMQAGVVWLAATDAPSLALLHSLLEEREVLRAAVMAGTGDRRQLRELESRILPLLGQLGFDPAARARLGLAEVKAQSKMEGIRVSQEKRMAAKVVKPNHANGESAG